ncbi:uncharacterized protein NEMAJ01_2332 [Nematocida major]|uniref:uncharacterized protein n=1 Tax=Nematocida major TaxID=1912982 RepID=UPI002007D151|nr:uncharacterized protein NEMAJ01_2332 [Nematocida major]KAH9387436.1 hypothetical protein NEMAJ01_2332 [Nematocida major]
MGKYQHINTSLYDLKYHMLIDTVNSKAKDPRSTLLEVLSSRIKHSFKDIPEEKLAEIEALVDTFLQERLDPVLANIAKRHCAVSPEILEILKKEAIAEAPSELLYGRSALSTEIDYYTLKRTVTYKDFYMHTLKKKIELHKIYKETQKLVIAQCEKMLQTKGMERSEKRKFKSALASDRENLERLTNTLEDLLKEEKRISQEEPMEEEKEKCTEENIFNSDSYTLDLMLEKVKAYSSGDESNSSVYFDLKKITENNGKNITISTPEYQRYYGPNSKNLLSAEEKLEEKKRVYEKMSMYKFYEEMHPYFGAVVDDVYAYFRSLISIDAGSFIANLFWRNRSELKEDLEEPERAELKELLNVLEESTDKMYIIESTFFANLYRIHDAFQVADSPLNMLSAWGRGSFLFFSDDFKKIASRFPNVERNSGFGKAFHALFIRAYEKNERARQLHRNAMETEECLERFRTSETDETTEDYKFRFDEYEKFATENPVPDFSGSIEEISAEFLDDGVTPREIKVMLSLLKILQNMYTEELKDEAKPESERVELSESLSETEDEIEVLNQKLHSFADLSKEEAKRNECFRYAYLMKYKIECLLHIDRLKKEAEEEVVTLAKEVIREIEETPNNPEFNRKAKEMFDDVIEKEPHRLLTPEFIVENEHFLKELPKMVDELDKRIAETLGESSGKVISGKSKYHLTLQNSILALFFVFMLLSLGLVCNSEFS